MLFQDARLLPWQRVLGNVGIARGPDWRRPPRPRWPMSASPTGPTTGRRCSPAASGSASRWPAPWSAGPAAAAGRAVRRARRADPHGDARPARAHLARARLHHRPDHPRRRRGGGARRSRDRASATAGSRSTCRSIFRGRGARAPTLRPSHCRRASSTRSDGVAIRKRRRRFVSAGGANRNLISWVMSTKLVDIGSRPMRHLRAGLAGKQGSNAMRTLLAALAGLTLATLSLAAHAAERKRSSSPTRPVPSHNLGIANGDSPKRPVGTSNSAASIPAPTFSPPSPPATCRSATSDRARSRRRVSRGIDVKAFYISSVSGNGEALVVRPGDQVAGGPPGQEARRRAGLDRPLPASRRHQEQGIDEKEVQVIAIPQPEIVAACNRGDIDGGFVWDPALTELKKNGKVLRHRRSEVADRARRPSAPGSRPASSPRSNPGLPQEPFAGVIDKYQTLVRQTKGRLGSGQPTTPSCSPNCRAARRRTNPSALKNLRRAAARRADFRQVAGRRREERRRQDPQGHCRLPKDQRKITDIKAATPRSYDRSAIRGGRQKPRT